MCGFDINFELFFNDPGLAGEDEMKKSFFKSIASPKKSRRPASVKLDSI